MGIHIVPTNKPLPEFSECVALDLETTGLCPHQNTILSVALFDGQDTYILLRNFERLIPLLTNPGVVKVGHNLDFDLRFLKKNLHVDIVNVFCTFICEKLLTMGLETPCALYDVAARRCGVILNKETREGFIDHPGWDSQPITNEQITYMQEDVLYLLQIREQQLKEISKVQLGRTLKLELEVLPIIVQMKLDGLKLDVPLWEEYAKQIETQVQTIKSQMVSHLGPEFKLFVPRTKKGVPIQEEIPVEKINFGSSQQMLQLLNSFELTTSQEEEIIPEEDLAVLVVRRDNEPQLPSKKKRKKRKVVHKFASTGEPALNAYLEVGTNDRAVEFIKLLLDYRNWVKMSGWNYPEYINPVTGSVHPEWRQLGPETGRMACANPNLQNVPRPHEGQPNLRKLWIPDDEDHVIILADYAQQEPKVLAQHCQDTAMLEACNSDDVYISFAKYMYGREVDKKSEERQIAKQFVLAVGYGAGATKLHSTSKLPFEECERIRNIIRTTFPGMVSWAQQQYRQVMTYGYCTTALGRRRYFPPNRRKFTEAVNTSIQGTAADMLKLSLVKINNLLTREKLSGKIGFSNRLWMAVHDEVEIHVHKSVAEQLFPYVLAEMKEAGEYLCPDVFWIAEGKILPTWNK